MPLRLLIIGLITFSLISCTTIRFGDPVVFPHNAEDPAALTPNKQAFGVYCAVSGEERDNIRRDLLFITKSSLGWRKVVEITYMSDGSITRHGEYDGFHVVGLPNVYALTPSSKKTETNPEVKLLNKKYHLVHVVIKGEDLIVRHLQVNQRSKQSFNKAFGHKNVIMGEGRNVTIQVSGVQDIDKEALGKCWGKSMTYKSMILPND